MEKNEITKKVIALAAQKLSAKTQSISEQTSFEEDLNADSIDIADFIMELENEFQINIPDNDLEKIRTVADAVNFVQIKMEKQ
jgi:acyl carrier protein